MAISKEEVKHIAYLARLSVNDKEINSFQKDLEEILNYVDRLKTVKTEKRKGVAVKKIFNIFRKDKINKTKLDCKIEDFLRDAPDKKNNFFKVPSIFK